MATAKSVSTSSSTTFNLPTNFGSRASTPSSPFRLARSAPPTPPPAASLLQTKPLKTHPYSHGSGTLPVLSHFGKTSGFETLDMASPNDVPSDLLIGMRNSQPLFKTSDANKNMGLKEINAHKFVDKMRLHIKKEISTMENAEQDDARLAVFRYCFSEAIKHIPIYSTLLSTIMQEYEAFIQANYVHWVRGRQLERDLQCVNTTTIKAVQNMATQTKENIPITSLNSLMNTEGIIDSDALWDLLDAGTSFAGGLAKHLKQAILNEEQAKVNTDNEVTEVYEVDRKRRKSSVAGNAIKKMSAAEALLSSLPVPVGLVQDEDDLHVMAMAKKREAEMEWQNTRLLNLIDERVQSYQPVEPKLLAQIGQNFRTTHIQNMEHSKIKDEYKAIIKVLITEIESKTEKLSTALQKLENWPCEADLKRLEEMKHKNDESTQTAPWMPTPTITPQPFNPLSGMTTLHNNRHSTVITSLTNKLADAARMSNEEMERLNILENELSEYKKQISKLQLEKTELRMALKQEQFRRIEEESAHIEAMLTPQLPSVDEAVPAPVGKIVLMFTDIQGSTNLWERSPDLMAAMLEVHNQTMRKYIAKHSGYEVKTQGDSFMITFSDVVNACRFTLDIQDKLRLAPWDRALDDIPESRLEVIKNADGSSFHLWKGLRVRIGLHLGEPSCMRDPITGRMDYFGPVVNKSARIESVAAGGMTVMSSDIEEVLRQHTAEFTDAAIRDIGEYNLKGISQPAHLYQLLPASLLPRMEQLDRQLQLQKQLMLPLQKEEAEPPIITSMVLCKASKDQLTALANDLTGDVVQSEIKQYLELLNRLCYNYHGNQVKTTGDSVLTLFESATEAAFFSMDLQTELLNVPWSPALLGHPTGKPTQTAGGSLIRRGLDICVAIHYGSVTAEKGAMNEGQVEYYGDEIAAVAAICSTAPGGHILISEQFKKQVEASTATILRDPIIEQRYPVRLATNKTVYKTFVMLPVELMARAYEKASPGDSASAKQQSEMHYTVDIKDVSDPDPTYAAMWRHFRQSTRFKQIGQKVLPRLERSRMAFEEGELEPQPSLHFCLHDLCGLEEHFPYSLSSGGGGRSRGRASSGATNTTGRPGSSSYDPDATGEDLDLLESARRGSEASPLSDGADADDVGDTTAGGAGAGDPEGIKGRLPTEIPATLLQETVYKVHEQCRNFFSLLRQYLVQFDVEGDQSAGPPMLPEEFIRRWVLAVREAEAAASGKKPNKKTERRARDEFQAQIRVALENERDINNFRADYQKLYRSVTGIFGKFFIWVRTFMKSQQRYGGRSGAAAGAGGTTSQGKSSNYQRRQSVVPSYRSMAPIDNFPPSVSEFNVAPPTPVSGFPNNTSSTTLRGERGRKHSVFADVDTGRRTPTERLKGKRRGLAASPSFNPSTSGGPSSYRMEDEYSGISPRPGSPPDKELDGSNTSRGGGGSGRGGSGGPSSGGGLGGGGGPIVVAPSAPVAPLSGRKQSESVNEVPRRGLTQSKSSNRISFEVPPPPKVG